MPGEERSGKGPHHTTLDVKGQGEVKPRDQQNTRGEKVTLGVKSLFSHFCLL